MQNTALMVLVCGIAALAILSTDAGRKVAAFLVFAFLAVAAFKVFVRTHNVDPATATIREIQPLWAGPCFPSDGSMLLKENGRYFLSGSGGGNQGQAYCFDWRVWK